MSRKEILYIAYRGEAFEGGISYALYLAGLMDAGLRIVLLGRDGVEGKFNDATSAAAFAGAGGHETARGTPAGENGVEGAASLQRYVSERCGAEGIRASVHIVLETKGSVIQDFLKRKKIDFVLLSPAVSRNRSTLNKLLKKSPHPVVTMARGTENNKELIEGGRSA